MTPQELFDAIMDPEKRTRVLFDGSHHRLITETVGSTDELCEVLCAVNWHAHAHYSLAPESKPWDDEQWWVDRFPYWVDWFYLTAFNSWIHAGTSDSVETKSAFRETEEGCLHMVEANRYWRPGRKPLDEAFGDQR